MAENHSPWSPSGFDRCLDSGLDSEIIVDGLGLAYYVVPRSGKVYEIDQHSAISADAGLATSYLRDPYGDQGVWRYEYSRVPILKSNRPWLNTHRVTNGGFQEDGAFNSGYEGGSCSRGIPWSTGSYPPALPGSRRFSFGPPGGTSTDRSGEVSSRRVGAFPACCGYFTRLRTTRSSLPG